MTVHKRLITVVQRKNWLDRQHLLKASRRRVKPESLKNGGERGARKPQGKKWLDGQYLLNSLDTQAAKLKT